MYSEEDFRECICERNCLDLNNPPSSHPQLICSCHYSKENNCIQCDNSKCLECQSLPDPYKHVREWESKRIRKKRTIYLIGKYTGFNFFLRIINKLADYIFDSALPFVMRTVVYIGSILFILYIIVFSTAAIYDSVTDWFADVRGESSDSGTPYLVDETTAVEEETTTTVKIVNNTTTTTVMSQEEIDLMDKNFKEAWEENLKEPITLTKEEVELTEYLYSLWTWKGDKWNPQNENFYELKINGLTCSRIYSSMGFAWLDEIHPVKQSSGLGYVATERYGCDPVGDFTENSLFGAPFYYQERWWIYQGYDFSWDQIDCKNPCGSSIGYFATRVAIDLDDEIYNVSLPDG